MVADVPFVMGLNAGCCTLVLGPGFSEAVLICRCAHMLPIYFDNFAFDLFFRYRNVIY